MKVQDVMTADVISVAPETSVHKAAALVGTISSYARQRRGRARGGGGSSRIPRSSRASTRRPPAPRWARVVTLWGGAATETERSAMETGVGAAYTYGA